jgi:hypothetical protein
VASISFNQHLMQVHVAQPGATAVISGTWDGPPESVFSLAGAATGGHKDALDAEWQSSPPEPGRPGEAAAPGIWDATVRFYHTGLINLTVTLTGPAASPVSVADRAQAMVTMDDAAPDLAVLTVGSFSPPLPALPVSPRGASLPVQAQSRSDLGPRTMSWQLQQTGTGSAANTPGTNLWTGNVMVAPAPLGSQPLTVTVTCSDAPDVTKAVTVPLTLVDGTASGPEPVAASSAGGSGSGGIVVPVPPSIMIGPVQGALAGVPVKVTGTVSAGSVGGSGDPYTLDGVSVQVDSGSQMDATWPGGTSWSAEVRFPWPGQHTLTATLTYEGVLGRKQTRTAAEQVTVGDQPVSLTVVSPLTSPSLTYQLQVEATSPIGVGLVTWSTDAGATWSSLTSQDGTRWTAAVPLPVANPVDARNGAPVSLTVGGFDKAQAPGTGAPLPSPPSQQVVRVTAADSTPPLVVWQAPPDGSAVEIVGGATPTAQATVTVTVTDDANGVVSAGVPVSPIACTVDGGTPVSLGKIAGGDPVLWQANVTLQGLGAHTLKLVCTDNAGNTTTLIRTVTVRQAGALTTSAQDYLADLLDYAGNRIVTSVTGGRSVIPLDLADALCEPFLDLAGAGGRPRVPAERALAPVNAVRGAIEVLRGYLTPPAAGRWRLDEGTGTVARDDTGHGCDGTLVAASWGPGRAGGAAPVFDGSSSYIQVGSLPQLDLRGGELTVAAWINPTGAAGGVVAGRDQSYAVARINGTLQWILATSDPGWNYQDTGVAVPQGQWSHVAVCYDGANVRAYLNGMLVSAVAASGSISPVTAGGGDFRIGCRQTGNQLFFAGSISDVTVYAHALSGYDVQLLAGNAPSPATTWLDGNLPPGAQVTGAGNEGFTWTTANPAPFSAPRCHQSPLAAGLHQHYFTGMTGGWPVDRFDRLYAYVYLDPANPPQEVMLQWFEQAGGWEHRAFWGDDMTPTVGTAGSRSRRHMGPLPPTGQWIRLDVMASSVGLESTTITGLAFTLYGGQAWWDVSGKSAGVADLATCGYPAAAYQALLSALGTSLEELRGARGATLAVRAALAGRLGIALSPGRPDQLDQLLLAPSTVTETDLESRFGLQRTDTDPLAGGPGTPLLLGWQQQRLRTLWGLEDYATTSASDYTPPVIDPDIVATADLVNAVPGQPAFGLWQVRATWVQDQTRSLQQLRAAQPSPAAGLNQLITHTLPGFDLQATAGKLADGYDITGILAQELLDQAGFDRLLTLSSLAAVGPLTDDEWDDACAILVQVVKTRQFPAWRQEEQAAGILLDPAVFTVATAAVQLPRWRATWSGRLRWQDRLAARADQLANLEAGLGSALAAAEQAALPVLRDAALRIAAPDDADMLSSRLCVDLQAGPQLTTTRLDRAAQAMQGLFTGLDAGGGLSGVGLAWAVPVPSGYPDLDSVLGELSWMGQYSSWLAAMSVFLYPESHVLPSTWPASETTPAFQDFLSALAGLGPGALTEQGARQLAAGYWNDPSWGGPPQPAYWPVTPAPPGYPPHITPPATGPDPWPPHAASGHIVQQYPYQERLSEADLAALRYTVQRAQFTGYASFTAIDARLRELFFDLPMQLALSLAQSGQWRGALGWLRIVYDREQPRPPAGGADQRQIFAGFALEAATETITRDENWLNGGRLDAHTIAGERAHTYLRFTLMTIAGVLCDWADTEFSTDTDESRALAASLYRQALDTLSAPELTPAPGLPPNPELTALTSRATVNLTKLRSGLNIAGLTRPLVSTANQASTVVVPPPTSYRYATLTARAQQLITLAAQMEASYLASLEKQDNENYQQLLAQQDLNVAGAHVTIANEQASIATDEVGVATLQVQRAQTQSDTYASWISAGPNQYEQDQLTQIGQQQQWQNWAAGAQATAAIAQGVAQAGSLTDFFGAPAAVAAAAASAAAAGFSDAAQQAALTGQADALQASWERRQDEWNLQKQLADADVTIGQQQVVITQARAQVASDEAALASLTQSNAAAKLNFLQTKLTNAALYQWMAGVLGSVYRYLLQRAAAVARLAEQQLAFERQAAMPGYIKSDYWTTASGGPVPATGTAGLTGSARLLEDITQLDQYALDTNTRKLQLTQAFSLATLASVDVQRFRDTGVLPFTVPLSSFGVPGMYLATIRTLRISIAALIPPSVGVRGTLAGGGSSHIVVNSGTGYDTVTLARPPETIVVTAPANASGVFQVDLTPELELPWEGCGLDIPLELRLPKAINPFDYRTIADVQISVDYTALYSPDYAAQVISELPSRISNSLALNLSDYPDDWYQLVTQAQAAAQATPLPGDPLLAQWAVTADMFPVNLADLAVEQITLLALRIADTELGVDHLRLNGLPSGTVTGATTVGHIVSTRNGSGAAWNTPALIGASPVGTWEVGLTADPTTIKAVAGGDVQDLVLVISYGGSVPAWPT